MVSVCDDAVQLLYVDRLLRAQQLAGAACYERGAGNAARTTYAHTTALRRDRRGAPRLSCLSASCNCTTLARKSIRHAASDQPALTPRCTVP